MDLDIIYEDKHIIALEKPPKIPSQSDKTGDKDIMTIINEYFNQKYPEAKEHYVGLIHRLDRPVGGVMIFAKTKESNKKLSEQVREKNIKKQYVAVVCGSTALTHSKLTDYLWKNERLNVSKVVSKGTNNAKEAILEYDILETINTDDFGTLSLIRINLCTGRHHQIRVQLANINLPIWGDTKYNKEFAKVKEWTQIALWAESIEFKHPIKAKNNYKITSVPLNQYPFILFPEYTKSISNIKRLYIQ